jgi:hypothetical protein
VSFSLRERWQIDAFGAALKFGLLHCCAALLLVVTRFYTCSLRT